MSQWKFGFTRNKFAMKRFAKWKTGIKNNFIYLSKKILLPSCRNIYTADTRPCIDMKIMSIWRRVSHGYMKRENEPGHETGL